VAAGQFRQSTVKDGASSSHSHAGSVEPAESRSSTAQPHRPTSEPITKPSRQYQQQQQLQHHIFARLKVASDEALHAGGHAKKPKSGIETSTAATVIYYCAFSFYMGSLYLELLMQKAFANRGNKIAIQLAVSYILHLRSGLPKADLLQLVEQIFTVSRCSSCYPANRVIQCRGTKWNH